VLVLTRKLRQSIMIGDDIEITVLSSDGAKVRLGIQEQAGETVGTEQPISPTRRRRAR
jgi:carbon storage regulator CsrA